jgi:class 3 adenylate cyclase
VYRLDRLLEPLLEVVSRHGGVVNKLLGDGFMAGVILRAVALEMTA